MIIRDPLYGEFTLPAFLRPLVNAPEFRRLSEVRLININSPSLAALAEVRRYSHTLGVLRLAIENPLLNFSEEEHRALLASIIVHDAGTPAFAHLFEYQLHDRFDWDHESVVTDIMLKRHHPDGNAHQYYSAHRPKFESLCRSAKIDFDIVLAILQMQHAGSKLIFGSLDFDNIDNVARMSFMLGHVVDAKQMLSLAAAISSDQHYRLILSESQRPNLKIWSELRRRAYEVLIYDPQTVAGQAVISTLLSEALERGSLSADDWHYTDHQLIAALRMSSSDSKLRLERDFFGELPTLRFLYQTSDAHHPLYEMSAREIAASVVQFLREIGIQRPYGYSFRDRGTFEKKIDAIDPHTGREWCAGDRSDSCIVYGFGSGTKHMGSKELGQMYSDWLLG